MDIPLHQSFIQDAIKHTGGRPRGVGSDPGAAPRHGKTVILRRLNCPTQKKHIKRHGMHHAPARAPAQGVCYRRMYGVHGHVCTCTTRWRDDAGPSASLAQRRGDSDGEAANKYYYLGPALRVPVPTAGTHRGRQNRSRVEVRLCAGARAARRSRRAAIHPRVDWFVASLPGSYSCRKALRRIDFTWSMFHMSLRGILSELEVSADFSDVSIF